MKINKPYVSKSGVLLAAAAGMGFGPFLNPVILKMLMPPALFFMLYPAMLDVDFRQLARAVQKPGLILTAFLINFILSPLLIFGLLKLLFSEPDQALTIGLVLYGIIPCGAMVPAFTGLLRGNVVLSATILAVSLFLSIAMIPVWTKILIGTLVPVPFSLILNALVIIVALPLLAAQGTRKFIQGKWTHRTYTRFRGGWKTVRASAWRFLYLPYSA